MADGGARRAAGVVVGVLSVVAVTWLRAMLVPVAGSDMALIFYILTVILAAGVGGATAGILTTTLSLAAGIAFIIGPHSFATSATEWIRVAVFVVEGAAISLTIEQLQRRTKRLRDTALELESQRRLVERIALEDVMTGLANRRAFERDLERLVAQSIREHAALTVAVADIDGLKRINDTLGHEQGDALLVAVAAALQKSCRASDEAFRIGGDEFALLLPGTDCVDYDAFVARLDTSVQEACAPFPGTGLSIGAAHAPADGNMENTLLRLADSRMYEVKASRLSSNGNRPTSGST